MSNQMSNQESNGLGIAGFVVSLVGIGSCGLISPVGLILSMMAMKREPKGLAIAGLVLGVIGSLWLIPLFALGLLGGILALFGLGAAVIAGDQFEASFELDTISAEVTAYIDENGSLPASLDDLSLETWAKTDPWGNVYRYSIDESGAWTLSSDGEDGVAGTADDVHRND